MLYAIRHPLALPGLILGFLVGSVLHSLVQAHLATRWGDPSARLAGRLRPDLGRHLDPFGAVAAALGGIGWAKPPELGRLRYARGRLLGLTLAGAGVNFVLAAAGFAGYLAAGGGLRDFGSLYLVDIVRGSAIVTVIPFKALLPLTFGMVNLGMGLLSLIPVPPLDAGPVLFAYGPKTQGWRQAEYRLAEQNWGVAAVLLLLIIPLAGSVPLLLYVVDSIAHGILSGISSI